jgi:hypothetical protein
VLTERGDELDFGIFGEDVVEFFGNVSRSAMGTGNVRRQEQYPLRVCTNPLFRLFGKLVSESNNFLLCECFFFLEPGHGDGEIGVNGVL